MNSLDIIIGHYIAALDWGHYAKIDRMARYLCIAPNGDTHLALIKGGDETRDAHLVYHVQSRRYTAAGAAFDPYERRLVA